MSHNVPSPVTFNRTKKYENAKFENLKWDFLLIYKHYVKIWPQVYEGKKFFPTFCFYGLHNVTSLLICYTIKSLSAQRYSLTLSSQKTLISASNPPTNGHEVEMGFFSFLVTLPRKQRFSPVIPLLYTKKGHLIFSNKIWLFVVYLFVH